MGHACRLTRGKRPSPPGGVFVAHEDGSVDSLSRRWRARRHSVAAFAMERLGVRVFQLPTTILGRRPDRGPPGGGPLPKETLASLLEGLAADGALGEIDAVLSGYVGDSEQVEVILDAVERVKAANPNALYVCDPVLGDEGKGLLRQIRYCRRRAQRPRAAR